MLREIRELRELMEEYPVVANLVKPICPVFQRSPDRLLACPTLLDNREIEDGYPLLIIQKWEGDGDPAFTAVFARCGIIVEDLDDSQEEDERQLASLCYRYSPETFTGVALSAVRACAWAEGGEPRLYSVYVSVYRMENMLVFIRGEIPIRDLEVRDYGGYTFD